MGCVLSLLKSYKDLEVFIFVLDFFRFFLEELASRTLRFLFLLWKDSFRGISLPEAGFVQEVEPSSKQTLKIMDCF